MSKSTDKVMTTGSLRDYATGEYIREATESETLEGIIAAESDGGVGAISIAGKTCYVEGGEIEYDYATDSTSGVIEAGSLRDAYDLLRAEITESMVEDGATLWVESPSGERLTMDADGSIR